MSNYYFVITQIKNRRLKIILFLDINLHIKIRINRGYTIDKRTIIKDFVIKNSAAIKFAALFFCPV